MNQEQKKLSLIKTYNETEKIETQMPIELEGGFIIAELLVICNHCLLPIPQALIHGYATKPMPNTASFQAVCVCYKCNNIQETVQRIKRIGKNTLRMEKLSPTGVWNSYESNIKPDNWMMALLKRILGLSS